MNYTCDDAAEALAAYALDALSAGERLMIIEHLAECRAHDEELASYRMVTGRLPLVVETQLQPEGLRSSLLDAFDRAQSGAFVEPTSLSAVEPEPMTAESEQAPEPAALAPKPSFLSIFRQPALAYGIAAALLIAVVSLAAWNISLQDGDDVMTTAAAAPGMSLRVSYYEDQQVAVFDLDMPEPASGQVYQAWMIDDAGAPVSLGVLASHRGRQAFAADMGHAGAVAISLEPAGGSLTPTKPVVEARF